MNKKLKKPGYEALKMEAASFRTESGYAVSDGTQQFTNVAINFGS